MTPQELIAALDGADRRQRRSGWVACVAAVTAAALLAALVLGAADWLVRARDPGLRWIALATLITAAAAAGYWMRGRVDRAPRGRLRLAERLESRLGQQSGSRISSAVAFFEQKTDDPLAGSSELRRAVLLDAARQTPADAVRGLVDEQPRRSAGRWLGIGVAAVLAVAAVAPTSTVTAAQRLLTPWSSVHWPLRTQLVVVEAPEAVALGEAFEVVVANRQGPVPGDATIEYRFAASNDSAPTTERRPLQLVGDDALGNLDQVQRAFSYRVTAGDDDTMPWRDVAVLDPPRIDSLTITITPPEYSGLVVSKNEGGPLRVLGGTDLALTAAASEPLDSATVRIGDRERPIALEGEPSAERTTLLGGWIAEPLELGAATYRLQMVAATGVSASTGPQPYTVVTDEPPVVEWSSGGDDYVTARAIIPINLSLADDLAIASATLAWRPFADAEGNEQTNAGGRVELFTGPEQPPGRESLDEGERRSLDYDWDLEPLGLAPGTEIAVVASARDYKPNETETPRPSRIVVLSDEQFEAQLAAEQSRLVEELTRALELQRTASTAGGQLAIEAATGEADPAALREGVGAAEYRQQLASESIGEPRVGSRSFAQQLADRARRNRLNQPDLVQRLEQAAEELGAIASAPQAEARRALAAARRAAGSGDPVAAAKALAAAQPFQTEASDRLESLTDSLAGWADYGRFAQELVELEEAQRAALDATRQQIAAAANRDPLAAADRQTAREKLLATQADLQRRFGRLEQSMRNLLDKGSDQAGRAAERAANAVRDALADSAESGLGSALREASREMARNRLGRATAGQARAAEGLERMLDTLRGAASADPDRLIGQLQEAQQQLNRLQQEASAAAPSQLGELSEPSERLGRQLDRLTAPQAGAAMQAAADQMAGQSPAGGQDAGNPSASQRSAAAQQSMDEASREIEERIAELENQATQRLLDQLASRMPQYIAREADVLDRTTDADLGATPGRVAERVRKDQAGLRDDLEAAADSLARRAVFELALRSVAATMDRAAERLAIPDVGRTTQRLEADALRRLKSIAEVLEQNQHQQEEQEEQGGGGGGGGGGEGQPSPVDVAELKMLRLTQLDLVGRTDAYEADTARSERLDDPSVAPGPQVGRSLAAEQRRLAELAAELAARDNDPEAETPEAEPAAGNEL